MNEVDKRTSARFLENTNYDSDNSFVNNAVYFIGTVVTLRGLDAFKI